MIEIVRYTADKADEWNRFVGCSKNATFLFDRRYMDYHVDRFRDHSLMVYDRGRLYALLPANDDGQGTWCSHQGLTYGGLVMDARCRAAKVCNLFTRLNGYLRDVGFQRVLYKPVPWIYCDLPAEEDAFALSNVCHATLCSRDVATVVVLDRRLPFTRLRRHGVKKAARAGVEVSEAEHLAPFWQLLQDNLWRRFGARPVHSLQEIELLRDRFPQHIRLFVATAGDRLLGGTLLYVCGHTVKTQYISANEEGRATGALDLLFQHLLDQFARQGMRYFDFGTSNKAENNDLNETLIFQKEGFGGRAVCYDQYEWTL